MLGVSVSQLAVAGIRSARGGLRARALQNEAQHRLRRETQHARLASELNWQTGSAAGVAWRVVEVIEIVDESADCRSFYLRDPGGAALPDFRPGQFIAVRPALGGHGMPTRCYSLSDRPGQDWWRITVKRVAGSAETHSPPGRSAGLSAWLHDRIGVGDCLLVHGPGGEFTLNDESTAPLALLAAGVGITPLISMLKVVLEQQPNRPVRLFFQAQDERHWPFGHLLHNWQAQCPSLRVMSYFSRAASPPDVPHGVARLGKLDSSDILQAFEEPEQMQVFMCGPDTWMTSMVDGLVAAGVARAQIHFESFGTGIVATSPAEPVASEPWSLRFSVSGIEVPTNTEAKTIWQAAKEQGLELPAACHTGACGTCRLKLRQGSVRYASEPAARCENDEALACVAQPVGQVVLDA